MIALSKVLRHDFRIIKFNKVSAASFRLICKFRTSFDPAKNKAALVGRWLVCVKREYSTLPLAWLSRSFEAMK